MDEYPETKSEAELNKSATHEQSSAPKLISSNKQLAKAEERVSLIALVLLTVMGGTLVSFYVLGFGSLTVRKTRTNRVAQAVLMASDLVSQITVEHPSFGYVGITDRENISEGIKLRQTRYKRHIIGVNTLYKTLYLDAILARRLNQPVMLNLVHEDLRLAQRLEKKLREKLYQAAQQGLIGQQIYIGASENYPSRLTKQLSDSIYHQVYSMLMASGSDRDTSLVAIRLILGRPKLSNTSSRIAGGGEPDLMSAFDKSPDDNLKAGILPYTEPISLITLGEKTGLIDAGDFIPTTRDQTPSAVLLEVVYENQSKKTGSSVLTITQRACALLGGKPVSPPPSCFVISFPDGAPPQIKKPSDLFKFDHWSGQGGWQQVMGGEIPGKGRLAPIPKPVFRSMSPSDAVAVAVYHWLKHLGPNVDPKRFLALFATPWQSAFSSSREKVWAESAEHFSANSCLVRDTGAREYAITNLTSESNVGQFAISRCFWISVDQGGHELKPRYPPSALPLVVDAKGEANLPGWQGFDYGLVKDFFKATHETNLAALESLARADEVLLRSERNLGQLEQRMLIERQELNSMRHRLSRLIRQNIQSNVEKSSETKGGGSGGNDSCRGGSNETHAEHSAYTDVVAKQARSIEKRILELSASREDHQEQYVLEKKVHELAELAKHNAQKIAKESFELTSRSFKLCQEGLYRIDSRTPQFLIGRRLVFVPQTIPLQDADFEVGAGKSDSGSKKTSQQVLKARQIRETSPWLSKGVSILVDYRYDSNRGARGVTKGKDLSEIEAVSPKLLAALPETIVLDSDSILPLRSKKIPQSKIYRSYPFSNIRFPPGQLFYYCQNALNTGTLLKLSWSAVIRDLVAYKVQNAKRSVSFPMSGAYDAGEPIPASGDDWCRQEKELSYSCPHLACEVQIRTPLPILDASFEGAYLTNPDNNAQVPQLPPVPPDLL